MCVWAEAGPCRWGMHIRRCRRCTPASSPGLLFQAACRCCLPQGLTHIDIPAAAARKTEIYLALEGETQVIAPVMAIAHAAKAWGALRCTGLGGVCWGLRCRALAAGWRLA